MQQNAVEFGASLVVWWLRLHAPNAGSLGLIPGQGTRSHVPQLRVGMPKDPTCCIEDQRSHVLQIKPGTTK